VELSLLNLTLILLAAWLGGNLASRLGYPSVLGELIAGFLLGPPLLGILKPDDGINVLAQVGVLLMMLYVGLEINIHDMRKASWAGFLASLGGFIVPFLLGYALTFYFLESHLVAAFVGMALGVTALAVNSRILLELNILDTRVAHVMMVGALITDTISLLIFAGILSLSTLGSLNIAAISLLSLKIVGFFILTWFIGLKIVPRLYGFLRSRGLSSRTFNATLILLIAFVFAELAELVGLHGIIGTFLAGLYLREAIVERKLSHELSDLVKDVSLGFLAPIYFVTAGFQVSFEVFQTNLLLLLLLILVAIAGKIIGTTLFYLPSGHGWREGLVIGAGMNGRGVVEIIIANIGLQASIINKDIFSMLVFMAIITTAMTPTTLQWGISWLKKYNQLVRSSSRDGVVIVGAGPVARLLATELSKSNPVTLLDANESNCKAARDLGLKAISGNALSIDVLRDAHIEQASTLIALTPNPEVHVLVAQRAREYFLTPELRVLLTEKSTHELVELLEDLKAKPLFMNPVNILEWDNKLLHNQAQTILQTIEQPNDVIGFQNPALLPLLVTRGKAHRLFSLQELEPGDRVLSLKQA
jgi:Kef-type K+ transport system membrane component KefB